MQLNAVDIRTAFISDPVLFGIFANRVYWRKTIKDPGGSYVLMQRDILSDGQVDENDRIEFIVFEKDTLLLEEHLQKIREFFTGRKILNGQEYWKVVFVDILEGAELNSGYYYSSIRFIFYKTT